MTVAPVPLLLDLWSTGLSASKIAAMLGTNRRTVHTIVEQARDIGDCRAVLHVGKNGRPLGRPNKGIDPADVEVVPAIPTSKCRRGHLRTADSTDRHGNCRKCLQRKCRRGHRLTKKNTIINASGPQCRECKNIVHQLHYQRNCERKKLYAKQRYHSTMECSA